MAYDYDPQNNSDDTPDYSSLHDYSEDEPDYSNMSDRDLGMSRDGGNYHGALRDDLLGGGYERKNFGQNFRDKYKETKGALDAAEKGEGHSKNGSGRDIGKQERSAKEPAWKTNLDAKRQQALASHTQKYNEKTGILTIKKKGAITALVGLVIAGGMSKFMLPAIAVAEFGQIANWLHNTTQTVHELATGARSFRNVMVSATG